MKKMILSLSGMLLWIAPLFAAVPGRADFALFLDGGAVVKGAEGRYGADFGRSFLDLAGQVRLGGNVYAECSLALFPEPRPNDDYFYDSAGFELALDVVWKFAPMKKASPFMKIGLSYAWISSQNAWREIYYPDAGRETNRFLGLNVGSGVECRLRSKLLLRLGGMFTLVPNDGEGAIASWAKLFAGLGVRLK